MREPVKNPEYDAQIAVAENDLRVARDSQREAEERICTLCAKAWGVRARHKDCLH